MGKEEILMEEIEREWENVTDMRYTLDKMEPRVAFGALCTLVDYECDRLGLTLDEWYWAHRSIKKGAIDDKR